MSSDGSGNKYAETEEILKEVVGLFSLKSDPAIVRDAGRAIVELQSSAQKRHAEMLAAIKELSGVVESAHKDHEGLELTAAHAPHARAPAAALPAAFRLESADSRRATL